MSEWHTSTTSIAPFCSSDVGNADIQLTNGAFVVTRELEADWGGRRPLWPAAGGVGEQRLEQHSSIHTHNKTPSNGAGEGSCGHSSPLGLLSEWCRRPLAPSSIRSTHRLH